MQSTGSITRAFCVIYGALRVRQIRAGVIKGGHSDGFWKWVLALVANSDSDCPDQWSLAIGNIGLVICNMAPKCQKWSKNIIGPLGSSTPKRQGLK